MRRILVLLCLGMTLLSSACKEDAAAESESNSHRGQRALQVEAVLPESREIQAKGTATGTFIAEDAVLISSEIAGNLKRLYFREGQFVKKGTLLGKINDSELQAEKKRLQVQLEFAKKELARAEKLRAVEAITSEELDSRAQEIELLNAEIDLLDARIAKTAIIAPFSGVLGVKMLSAGTYLNPGQGIVELQKISPIKLEFFVPEKYADAISVNDSISFTSPATTDTFYSSIYLINPSIGSEQRALRVRCRIDNRRGKFIPGGYAQVQYGIGGNGQSLMLPAEAIIPVLDGQKVLIQEHGKVVSRAVEIGIRGPENVQITSGISAKDTVLVTGILSATDGMDVEVSLKEIP